MKRFLGALLLVTTGVGAQALMSESELKALLSRDNSVVVLDVRTAEEFATGHLSQAKLLPYDAIDANTAAKVVATKKTPVVVYCRSGRRSAVAAQALKALGYTNIADFGGLTNWKGPLVR